MRTAGIADWTLYIVCVCLFVVCLTNRGVYISAVIHTHTRTSTHTFTHNRQSLESKNVTRITNFILVMTQNLTSFLYGAHPQLMLMLTVTEQKCIGNFNILYLCKKNRINLYFF